MGSLVELRSYTERKGWEKIATLASSAAPIPLPPAICATHPDYIKTLPQNLPFFWLSLADPAPDQQNKFYHYLAYLAHGRGDSPPKCLRIQHEAYLLYFMPPEDVSKTKTQIKCCYAPNPQYQPPPKELPTPLEDIAGSIHPRFLKTQSHIHAEWILGGFAELIHNSLDAGAKKLSMDVEISGKSHFLHFTDNGVGMEHKDLVRMLCFGHEDEGESQRIGKFGVGFKTGSMRIADDAIVFTRTKTSQSVGLLSQTSNTGKKTLTVPIVTWKRDTMEYDLSVHTAGQVKQLVDYICQFSPFTSVERLQSQFEKIGPHGTHVVLFNLRMTELDFTADPKDIQVATPGSKDHFIKRRPGQQTTNVPIDYSLKALCSVMFLTPKMAISVRGQLVQPRRFAETLEKIERHTLNGSTLLLGFNENDKKNGLGGFMMYWHGVLIQAYHRIGIMLHNTDAGNGVIGIIECNNLEPLNNKQAFNEATPEFRANEKGLEHCLTKYWYEKIDTKDQDLDPSLQPESTWAYCNKCGKWRLLPPGTSADKLPEYWFCRMNPDTKFNSCEIPEQDTSEHKTVTLNNTGENSKATKNNSNNNNKTTSYEKSVKKAHSPPNNKTTNKTDSTPPNKKTSSSTSNKSSSTSTPKTNSNTSDKSNNLQKTSNKDTHKTEHKQKSIKTEEHETTTAKPISSSKTSTSQKTEENLKISAKSSSQKTEENPKTFPKSNSSSTTSAPMFAPKTNLSKQGAKLVLNKKAKISATPTTASPSSSSSSIPSSLSTLSSSSSSSSVTLPDILSWAFSPDSPPSISPDSPPTNSISPVNSTSTTNSTTSTNFTETPKTKSKKEMLLELANSNLQQIDKLMNSSNNTKKIKQELDCGMDDAPEFVSKKRKHTMIIVDD